MKAVQQQNRDKLPEVCVLETSGFRASFIFTRDESLQDDFHLVVEFSLHPELGVVNLSSVPGILNVSDVNRLIAYFGAHVEKLKSTKRLNSIIFFSEALNFSIDVLDGYFETETQAALALRIMVNVGRKSETAPSVYLGGEAYTDLGHLNDFLSSLRALNDLPTE